MSTAFVSTAMREENVLTAEGAIPVNCRIVRGQLLPALAPVPQTGTVPDGVTRARFCDGSGRFFLYADGAVYSSKSGATFAKLASLVARSPFIVEERTESGVQSVIAGDAVAILHTGEYQTAKPFEGNLSCGVIKCGRLFGADLSDGLMLRWSGEGGALDWLGNVSGAGWVYPAGGLGKILNVAELDGKLFAVRENGLTRVNANGTPENFAVERHFYVPSVCGQTVAAVGSSLYFCTAHGLYSYAGGGVKRLDDRLFDGMVSILFGAAFGNKYLVCGRHERFEENVVYVYDADGQISYLCSAPATAVCAASEAFAYGGGRAYALTEGGAAYRFYSGALTFGTVRNKVLEKLTVVADEGVDVRVSDGVNSRIFGGVRGEVRLNMRSSVFHITVEGNAKVVSLTATAEVENGV